MVKKKFIDKKNATTYNLVFRSTEDVDDVPERMLVDADKRLGVGRVDSSAAAAAHDATAAAGRRYPPGHPLAWLEEEAAAGPLSEARRRELIELGFPDDGYDYLKHMRVLGRGVAGMEGGSRATADTAAALEAEAAPQAAPGPSVYMPAPQLEAPEEDRQLIDASGLTVMQAVEEEGDAAVMAGGVTAFSKNKERVHGMGKRELDELEEAMRELEEAESLGDAEGFGDLLDDFVLAATEFTPAAEEEADAQHDQQGAAGAWSEDDDDTYSEVESYEEEGSSYAGSEGAGPGGSAAGRSGRPPARPGSIASTYWREERHDRKNLLTVIDEKFEHLALEYDDDEIGDLEEQGQEIRGFADVAEFDNLLDEFLEVHGQSRAAREGNVPYPFRKPSQVGQEMEFHGFDDADAAVAVEKAREAVRQCEAEELKAEEAAGSAAGKREDRVPVYLQPQERERWDCESILSLRSNLDNHPGRISEPRSNRRPRAASSVAGAGAAPQGIIRLDPRSGIPMGVLPRRGAGGLPEAAAGAQSGGAEAEEAEAEEAAEAAALPLERRKGESTEERKARKAAVKGAKRAAREQKKELKSLFKEASVAAQRRAATAQPQAALHLPS